MTDLRQTTEYAKYMQGLGWVTERIDNINYFIRKIPVIGSVMKIQRLDRISFKVIELLSKKYKVFQIIVEPLTINHKQLIVNNGFRQSRDFFAPSKTLQIDLTKPEKQLLSDLHQKTRYNIKMAVKNKLVVKESSDIETFADFWQKCALNQRGMFLSQKKEIREIYKAFDKSSHIVLIKKDKELLSGVLMICTKEVAYYVYAASTNDGKRLFAPTLAAWSAISLAKKLKKKIFDFEGIYDERFPVKSWQGFTRFKKSFGGKEIAYPGCYTKLRLPF